MAEDKVVRSDLDLSRFLVSADLCGPVATGPEPAPGRKVDRVRHIALQLDPDPACIGIRHGNG
jgi:hypothetical protein